MLTEREKKVYNTMLNSFVPALKDILRAGNPMEFKRWGENCCRQIAVFGVKVLEQLLPEYEWRAYDGYFFDIVYNEPRNYNHGWIYGKGKSRDLFVDVARIHQEPLFYTTNENKYPSSGDYRYLQEIQRIELPVDELLNIGEYFTEREGTDILKELLLSLDMIDPNELIG